MIAQNESYIYLNNQILHIPNNTNSEMKRFSEEDFLFKPSFSLEYPEYIQKQFEKFREDETDRVVNEILALIINDEFVDGEISESELFIERMYSEGKLNIVKDALMKLYIANVQDCHILNGILHMLSRIPYDDIAPQGQIMTLGLLSNRDLEIRDSAIHCYEKWNSKKGISVLKSLNCSPKWLQDYVEEVIDYIEQGGIE